MCGFLGQFSPQLVSKVDFLTNLAIANHRGPDQTGYWADANVQLGFNRLAIVDLSEAGHQPMQSNNGNWVVVFNGEIYNHLELREQFPNYNFRGHSDTETILASLEKLGFEHTIKSLIGMFAIAAYHKSNDVLYVARDSVGIKPFFYHSDPKDFWFASQFNQVIKGIGKHKVRLTPEGMRDFLQLGYMQAPNTIYANIKQLEPGQMATVDGKCIALKYFCTYPRDVVNSGVKDDSIEALEHFNQLFTKVSEDQLQADVPIATFLSSGIDSTLVNAYAKSLKSDLMAYTIGVGGSSSDERPVAEKYASHLGIHHLSESIESADLLLSLDDHFKKLGEPFADFSSIPTYLICKKARERSTVMLSGDGGDELFWGYHRLYKSTKNYNFFKESLILRRIKKKLKVFTKPFSGAIYDFKRADEMVENDHSHIALGLMPRLFKGFEKTKETTEIYSFQGKTQKEFRNWLRYNEFYAHMQRVLIKVDRMSMAHSLEVRVPLLDQRVVDFAWNLDSDFGLTDDKELKKFLKRALNQFIPKEVMNTKKMGFYVPIGKWLKTELKEEAKDLLLNEPIYGEEFIDRHIWNAYVNDFYNDGRLGNEWGIWIMYCWQKWKLEMNLL